MHRREKTSPPAPPVIRSPGGAVIADMSLEISTATLPWHKGFQPVPRKARRPVIVQGSGAGRMDATSGNAGEANMSDLLARVAVSRDVELFEQLFRHFAPRVKAYMARTGSAANAEELMQETMVAVWNKAALYDPSKGAASTWIFSIARNLRIDAYRRDRRPSVDLDDPALEPDPEPMADRHLEAEQAAQQVRAALAGLPPDQADVLRLAYFEDNSQSAIASALDLPLGTVKSRMRLAFAKLRAALAEPGDEL